MLSLRDNAFGFGGRIVFCKNPSTSRYISGELPVTVLDINDLNIYKVCIDSDTIKSEFLSGSYIFINFVYATDNVIVFDVKSEGKTRIFVYDKEGIPLGKFDLGTEQVMAVVSTSDENNSDLIMHVVTCRHNGDDKEFYDNVVAGMFFVRRQQIAVTKKNLTWVMVSEIRNGHIHVITSDPDFSEIVDYDCVFADQEVVKRVFIPASHHKKFIAANAGSTTPCMFKGKLMLVVAERDGRVDFLQLCGKNKIKRYSVTDVRIVHERNVPPIGSQVNIEKPLILNDYTNGDIYMVAGRKADDTYMMKIDNMRTGKVDYDMLYLPFNFYYNTVARWLVCNGIIVRYGCLTGSAIALYWKRADDTIGTSGLAYVDDEMYLRNLNNILVSLKKSRIY